MRDKLHVSHRTRVSETHMQGDLSAGDHDPASTRSCRPREKTTSNDNGPARSHPTIFPTSSPRFKSGKQMHGAFHIHERDLWTSSQRYQSRRDSTAWNTLDDQTVETLAHYMVHVRCAAFFDTLSREFLMLIPMGRTEDI